ncbi:hypothetical protein RhiirB3_387180 [Rhizophagus irregularis]|nr:hypothetical protein RhiirB3_387180 [Rhizophagus irregularis]
MTELLGTTKKKISALFSRSPRLLEKKKSDGENQRERNRRDLPGTKVQIKPTYSKEDQAQLKKDLMLAGGTRTYKIKILRSFKVIDFLNDEKDNLHKKKLVHPQGAPRL